MRETIQNANGKQFHAVSLSGGKDSTPHFPRRNTLRPERPR